MTVELIHPLDLAEMVGRPGACWDVTRMGRDDAHFYDDILEINGKLYLQSLRVEPKTKNIV